MSGEIIEILSSDDEDQSQNVTPSQINKQQNGINKSSILNCPFEPICGFQAVSFEFYLEHLSQFHSDNDKYICIYCKENNKVTGLNVTSLYLGQLRPHVEVLHDGIINFKPEIIEQQKTKPISRNLPVIQRVPVDKKMSSLFGCPVTSCHLHNTNCLSNINANQHIAAFHPSCLFYCKVCTSSKSFYPDGAMNIEQLKLHVDRSHGGSLITIIDSKPTNKEAYSNLINLSPRQLISSTVLQVPIPCPVSSCRSHTPQCAVHSAQVPYECSEIDRCYYDKTKDFFNHLVNVHECDCNFLCKSCYDANPNIDSCMSPPLLLNHMLQVHGGYFKGVTYLKKTVQYNPTPVPAAQPASIDNNKEKLPNGKNTSSDISKSDPSLPCGHTCFIPGCPVTRLFSNVDAVIAHIESRHANSRFDCQVCDFISKEEPLVPAELKLHVDACHDGKMSTIVVIVASCFVSKCSHRGPIQSHDQLLTHIAYHHAKSNFSCKICPPNDKILSAIEMKTHVHVNHKGVVNYIHELNRSDNDNDSDLEITEEIIPVKKSIDCSKCSMSFQQLEDYHLHVAESHHEMQFLCNFCRRLFKTLDEMRRHRKEDHPDELVYRCNHCHSFTARDVHQLKLHQDSCRQDCIYRCAICGFTSHDEKSYKAHLSNGAHRRALARKKANKYVKAAHNQILKKGSKPDIMVDKYTGQIYVGGQPLAPARNLTYKPPKRIR